MRVVSILMALGVALSVFLWLALANVPEPSAPETAAPDAAPIAVQAQRSVARPYERVLALTGVAEAARKVEVKAQTEGLVISAPRLKGAAVAAGDPLCEIETGERAAALARAKARLAQAAADARASSTLVQRGFSAETSAAADQAALEAARADVAQVELDIARTKIAAPFDGRLESDAADTGELLRSGDVCATVIDLDPIRFVGFAPETAALDVEVGAPAVARLVNGTEIAARVAFVARSADAETRTFRVEARAPNPDAQARDGATVELEIALSAIPAHALPHSALTLDASGRLGVRLVETGPDADAPIARFAPVRILRDDVDGVWVDGLPDRADVIVVGQEFVADGARIAPRYLEETADAR